MSGWQQVINCFVGWWWKKISFFPSVEVYFRSASCLEFRVETLDRMKEKVRREEGESRGRNATESYRISWSPWWSLQLVFGELNRISKIISSVGSNGQINKCHHFLMDKVNVTYIALWFQINGVLDLGRYSDHESFWCKLASIFGWNISFLELTFFQSSQD